MISKNVISEIRALHLLKNRREQGLFIAEGEKVVGELIQSGLGIKWIACLESLVNHFQNITSGVEIFDVNESELNKISLLQSPNKVLAVGMLPGSLQVNFSQEKNTVVVLDGIRDPGNFGTIVRTADWFGIKHIICSLDCVEAYNPKVVQGAMGSLFRMNIIYGDLTVFLRQAREEGRFVNVGATMEGIPYREFESKDPIMIVIGSESHGISEPVQQLLDTIVTIPRLPNSETESLNAGVACAILLAHFAGGQK